MTPTHIHINTKKKVENLIQVEPALNYVCSHSPIQKNGSPSIIIKVDFFTPMQSLSSLYFDFGQFNPLLWCARQVWGWLLMMMRGNGKYWNVHKIELFLCPFAILYGTHNALYFVIKLKKLKMFLCAGCV